MPDPGGSGRQIDGRSLKCACTVAVVALVMSPLAGNARTALTETQIGRAAEALIGEKPDQIETYFSKPENLEYFAFTVRTPNGWGREQVWVYEQPLGSGAMELVWKADRLWPGMDRYELPAGFVRLNGETAPCLRLKAYEGGMAAGTNRLGLFCIGDRHLFWVDYWSDFGPSARTGVQHVKISGDNAAEPSVRAYLLSWGHKLKLDVSPHYPAIDAVRRVQQLWLDANGRKPCSYQRTEPYAWERWKTNQVDKLTPYATRTLLKNPLVVLDEGRYQWLSYPGPNDSATVGSALAGVGRYDKRLHRYDLVYVPDSSFDYYKKLVIMGNWLYIQDCDDHWAVRFNTATHRLQRGDFDDIVGTLATGIYRRAAPTAPDQTLGFWTSPGDKSFRRGTFSPAVEKAILAELELLSAEGMNCEFGENTQACGSGAGFVDLKTDNQRRTQTLEVFEFPGPHGEEGFLNLCKIFLLLTGGREWTQQVGPGMRQLRLKYDGKNTSAIPTFGVNHYSKAYRVDLGVMHRWLFKMLVASVALEGGADNAWIKKWQATQSPEGRYWILGIVPRSN